MPMPTQTKEHQWTEFKMSAVVAIKDPITNGLHFVEDTSTEPVVTYGCAVCNMGAEEASTIGCPGFDVFEEHEGQGYDG